MTTQTTEASVAQITEALLPNVVNYQHWTPTVYVTTNWALGAALYAEVAKVLGRVPSAIPHSTGYLDAFLTLAAGLPVENDDKWTAHEFRGQDEIDALAEVLTSGAVTIAVLDADLGLLGVAS